MVEVPKKCSVADMTTSPLSKADEARVRVAIATKPGPSESLLDLRPLLAGALGTIDELRAQATAFARPTGDRSSAWNQALRLGALRDDLRTRNADASVRAVARRAQSSPGRVGELLQAYDTFKDIVLLSGQEAEGVLYNLSFRSLRSVARIPSVFARMRELRRLSNVAQRSERPHHEGPGEHEDHP